MPSDTKPHPTYRGERSAATGRSDSRLVTIRLAGSFSGEDVAQIFLFITQARVLTGACPSSTHEPCEEDSLSLLTVPRQRRRPYQYHWWANH